MPPVLARAWKLVTLPALAALVTAPACVAPAGAGEAPAEVVMLPDTSSATRAAREVHAGVFPVPLAAFATTLAGSVPERTENLRLAAAALDGRVLEPGEVLSFNAVVGPRTLERGYLAAPVILHERRQVQTGGGICQAASTLFVAALQAGFGTVERWRHSSLVDYIALGEDATIAWGAKDMRVRNDLDTRVRVRCAVVGSAFVARLEGETPVPFSYELAREERELPAEPGDGGAMPGREVELYRVRREAGQEVSRELVHRDVFPPSRGERPGSR